MVGYNGTQILRKFSKTADIKFLYGTPNLKLRFIIICKLACFVEPVFQIKVFSAEFYIVIFRMCSWSFKFNNHLIITIFGYEYFKSSTPYSVGAKLLFHGQIRKISYFLYFLITRKPIGSFSA